MFTIGNKTLDPFTGDLNLSLYADPSSGTTGNVNLSGKASDKAQKAGEPKAVFKAAALEMLEAATAAVKAL